MKAPPDPVLLGVNEARVLTGPRTVHLDITNACNTNCITCWDHSPHLDAPRPSWWKRQQADPAALEALLDDILTLGGLKAVIVSGMGDPFVHPEVDRIIAAVKARGLHLTIITNLIPADADRVIAQGVDQLLIGIHAASEASYLAFHPSFQPEAWARLHAMLARFQAAGRRFKHVHVICRTNAHELVDMVALAARYDAAQVNFKLASLKDGTEAVQIDAAQRARLITEGVPRAQDEAARRGVQTNLTVLLRQLGAGGAATAPIEEVGCFMGYTYARVLVDGTVLYCCNTDVKVGALGADGTFSTMWRGERWSALRRRMREGRYYASCRQCGKLNQNLKLAERFERVYGRSRLLAVTGRGEAS